MGRVTPVREWYQVEAGLWVSIARPYYRLTRNREAWRVKSKEPWTVTLSDETGNGRHVVVATDAPSIADAKRIATEHRARHKVSLEADHDGRDEGAAAEGA
jgi:hypothetical protein